MRLCYSTRAKPLPTEQHVLAATQVSPDWLRRIVNTMSIPRHFVQQAENNRWVGRWLETQLQSFGYQTRYQGHCRNLMTLPANTDEPLILVGAHYDSVPATPGADDNASAVAAMLACARAVAEHAPQAGVCFVAFNREEEELTGSKDFVADFLPGSGLTIREAHVLEMVGYCNHQPGSQRVPRGLPIRFKEAGDFLGILGNRHSLHLVDHLLRCAQGYQPDFPVIALKVYFGLERRFRTLVRSDHAPFWTAGIPALMWTDTAEFRNPNYHRPSDVPETLDYQFLLRVAQLLIAQVLTAAGRTR